MSDIGNPNALPAFPSPLDLARLCAEGINDRCDLTDENLYPVQSDVEDAIEIIDDREQSMADLAAAIPAVRVEDAIAQLGFAYRVSLELYNTDGNTPVCALRVRQLRALLISAIPTIAAHAGFDLGSIAAEDIVMIRDRMFLGFTGLPGAPGGDE